MLQDNTDSASRFGENIRDACVQEGYPVLAASFSSINHDDWCVGARDIMPLVNPVPLSESWRILSEVIDGLDEPLLREFLGRVWGGRWSVGVLDGERRGMGVLPSRL